MTSNKIWSEGNWRSFEKGGKTQLLYLLDGLPVNFIRAVNSSCMRILNVAWCAAELGPWNSHRQVQEMVKEGDYVAIFHSIHRVMKAEKILLAQQLDILLIPVPWRSGLDKSRLIKWSELCAKQIWRVPKFGSSALVSSGVCHDGSCFWDAFYLTSASAVSYSSSFVNFVIRVTCLIHFQINWTRFLKNSVGMVA